MVKNLFKNIVVKSWEYSAKRNLRNKFNLYGQYKKLYRWHEYKLLKEHCLLFKPLKFKVNKEWYKYITLIRQEENPAYVPEDIWHLRIEPVLNIRAYNKAFNDKNLFNLTDYHYLFPKPYLHIIEGIFYNPNYQRINKSKAEQMIPSVLPFVAKNTIDSGGGKGVIFYDPNENKISLDVIINNHGNNVIIQEFVKQHPWFEKFNKDSLNTIRVVTYRSVKDENIYILQTLLRMGKKGKRVDNQSSGGIACGINENGKLNAWGCDKLSIRYYENNGVIFKEVEPIPDFELLKDTCIKIAEKRFYERVLVFDTWRDTENNIRLTEINNINIGIEDLQKNNGPLLGDFTKEIIDFCANNSRSYCFDFKL